MPRRRTGPDPDRCGYLRRRLARKGGAGGLTFQGTVRVEARDREQWRGVIRAEAKDRKVGGSVAHLDMHLEESRVEGLLDAKEAGVRTMPRIFDNIDASLLPALCETLACDRADFCVGYFNLRGRSKSTRISNSGQVTLATVPSLVGMQRLPQDDLRDTHHPQVTQRYRQSVGNPPEAETAAHFREQLMLGTPTNADEAGLRRLAVQIKAHKVVVKLFLRHPLHAKLCLLFAPIRLARLLATSAAATSPFRTLPARRTQHRCAGLWRLSEAGALVRRPLGGSLVH